MKVIMNDDNNTYNNNDNNKIAVNGYNTFLQTNEPDKRSTQKNNKYPPPKKNK